VGARGNFAPGAVAVWKTNSLEMVKNSRWTRGSGQTHHDELQRRAARHQFGSSQYGREHEPHAQHGGAIGKAGEAVYSHRHTNAAMRFVIDGGEGVYTITDGEKCVMERGDLVIQPSWGWHNHINETERDAIWIDCLDSGLMRMLRTMFQEPHPAEDVRLFNSPVDTAARNPGLLAPPGQPLKSLVYKWRATRRALSEMLPENESPYDGKCLEYRNPVTGGSTFPTFSCWIQMLESGKETAQHRHTSSQLYYVVEGSGVTEVDGEKLAWEAGDFFVVPNWSWHRHKNASATFPAVLFSTTDRPLQEAIGVYREQTR
jgi:1-hydroxy-2-naphthoate dioxygenase